MVRRLLRALCVLAVASTPVLVALPATSALADGSRTLYPTTATCGPNSASGQCRAALEWRTGTYGPAGSQVFRRTLFTVFAKAGEVLELGSSAVGVGSGDITVWNPGVVTDQEATTLPTVTSGSNGFLCSAQRTSSGIAAQGMITSRALEVAGPQSADGTGNASGYVPCTYTAPTTGLYNVAFYGPSGANANTDGGVTGDLNLASANNFGTQQGTSIAAWDLTVRANAASTTDLTGRVFTYALAAYTGGNGRPIFQSMYVTTDDGYRYRVDTRGLDPNGFMMFGSRRGFLDPDGDPLDHDITGNAGGSAMSGVDGGTGIAAPEFPMSFDPLAPETLAALSIPSTPVAPTVNSLDFDGNIAANNSTISGGGTFSYDANVEANYQIVVSRDGSNFDPGNPVNKVLLGVGTAGSNTVAWDGTDNNGDPFPAGDDYPFKLTLHAGEYHFPLIDAENSTLGGPSFTLLNPPGGNCPFGRSSCTTAFYDDRGYTTSTGVDVGTPGSLLCGTNPPSSSHSDPVTGYDSAGTARAYGSDTGGNTNASCTGSFGDVKGLDTWTYYPSTTSGNTLNIVASPPPAPAATDDTGTVAAGSTLVVPAAGVLSNDSGTGLTVTANSNPPHGTATVNADGSYTYTPDSGFSGTDTFHYTVTDSLGRTATANVTITVTPTAHPDTATTDEGNPVSLDPTTNDEGTGVTLVSVDQPPAGQGTTSVVGGNVVYTPPAGFTGTTTARYDVTDADGNPAHSTITFTVNPPPPAAVADAASVVADGSVTVAAPGVLGNDSGTSISVTGHTAPAHGNVTVNADGSFTYTPDPGYSGGDSFHYTITDSIGRTATATVTITVTPIANPDTAGTANATPVTIDAAANDTGTGLSVISVGSPPSGQGTTTVSGGKVVYTPPAGFSGTVTVPYTVADSAGSTANSTITINVDPAAPVAIADSGSVVAGGVLTAAAPGVLGNDSGASLTVTSHTSPSHGSVVLNADGSYDYSPDAGYSGGDSFDYTVTDSLGRTATATVSITVTPVANPDSTTTTDGTPVSLDPTGNDVGTGLHVVSVSSPPAGQGTTTISGGQVVYTPPPGFSGTVTVPYDAADSSGSTASSTITFTVNPAAPVAGDDTGTVVADGTLTVAAPGVLGNDSGTGLSVTGNTTPAHGTATVAADGSYIYTPIAGYSGPDSFDYTVTDSLGRTSTATVSITVTPVAQPDSGTTTDGNPVTVDPTANDSGSGLTVTSVGSPPAGQGTTTVTGGQVVYTPPPGFTGTVTVPYTSTDSTGQTTSSTITFTVNPPAPVAADDSGTVAAGGTLTVAASGVLGNDSGISLSVTSHTAPPHGTVTVNANGSYTYTPSPSFSGTDSFDYTVTDSIGRTATAPVTITVTPTASPDSSATTPGGTVTVDPRGNDSGIGLAVTSVGQPPAAAGSTSIVGGSIVYVAPAGYAGTFTVPYTVTDGDGQTTSSTVTFTVTASAPVVQPDNGTTAVDTPLVVAAPGVLGNDTGIGLVVTAHTAPTHGTVSIQGSGGYTYTPDADYSGPDTFTYTITDASAHTATTTVDLDVTPLAVNDARTTPYQTPIDIAALANDRGTSLTMTSVGSPDHGTAVVNGTGVTFTPPAGFSGVAQFTYTATDSSSQATTATVRVTVQPKATTAGGGKGGGKSGRKSGGKSGGSTSGGDPSGADPAPSGRLPFTGAQVAPVLMLAGGSVGLGVLLQVVARRRSRRD